MSASMAEVIRLELRKGGYQMPGDTLPYETQAQKVAEVLAAAGYGKLDRAAQLGALMAYDAIEESAIEQARADAWDEGAYAYETRRARDESLPLINPYRRPE